MVARTALSLPRPLLRAAAGGGVVHRGGRTLNPRIQFLWKNWGAARPMTGPTPEDYRADWLAIAELCAAKPSPRVKAETVLLDGPAGVLTTRLYRPRNQTADAPLLVWLHSGGGVAGDAEIDAGFVSLLAETAGLAVLVPEYRLAPEHRFPAGLDDAYAAFRWARTAAERYGAREGTAAVGGLGAGAGFAAAITLALKRSGEAQPAFQLLVCPFLDATGESQSNTTYADAWPLSAASLAWRMGQYLHPEDDPFDPMLSPFRAEDVSGLAPAAVVTAGFDPLVDQGEHYARKLKRAGTPVIYRCYDELPHAFTLMAGVSPESETACLEIAGLARDLAAGRLTPEAGAAEDRSGEERSLVL
jgi:acetyl esterase/lipase